ncbi:Fos-related antigen [Trichinella pseudospiralis]
MGFFFISIIEQQQQQQQRQSMVRILTKPTCKPAERDDHPTDGIASTKSAFWALHMVGKAKAKAAKRKRYASNSNNETMECQWKSLQ